MFLIIKETGAPDTGKISIKSFAFGPIMTCRHKQLGNQDYIHVNICICSLIIFIKWNIHYVYSALVVPKYFGMFSVMLKQTKEAVSAAGANNNSFCLS